MLTLKEIASLNIKGLEHLKSFELVEIYNTLAKPLDVKTIKKFRDHATAVSRTVTAVEAYAAVARNQDEPTLAAKSFENETYALGPNPPMHKESAMGVLCWLVEGEGINEYTTLAESFIEQYSPTYTGVKDVNMSFARGYIKGALRAGHLIVK